MEDIGNGDLSAALVPAGQRAVASVLMRSPGILCGQPWFDEVFRQLDSSISVRWQQKEGAIVPADTHVCELSGPAQTILTGERTALNFLQTLSATATAARAYADAIAGTRTKILDTRKTLPGLRLAQKYAVRTGGAENHRIGLFDAVMIKENHIAACGSIELAVAAARDHFADVKIIVEVESLEQAEIALGTTANQILLDDMSLADMQEAVAMRDRLAPAIKLEASGNVSLTNVAEIARSGVDFISVGSITKHIEAADLSMRFAYA
jgi:nicotinate-nucleotide pyrophosphorylase (carboxylating)